jgi:hypothetical protein
MIKCIQKYAPAIVSYSIYLAIRLACLRYFGAFDQPSVCKVCQGRVYGPVTGGEKMFEQRLESFLQVVPACISEAQESEAKCLNVHNFRAQSALKSLSI